MPGTRVLAVDPLRAVGGTGQNLGYAFQWPAFAFFCVYAYRRFVRLEAEETEAQETGGAPRPSASSEPTEIPEELLPPRPGRKLEPDTDTDLDDPPENRQMLEYNDYLAQLARRSGRSGQ